MQDRYSIGIVGGGIVGLATALALTERFPRASIVVLEKERELAQHQSGHNSGVIHAGIYYTPGSYKARLCVQGVRLMTEFCEQNGIPYDRCGKLIVATEENELPRLRALHERALANGIPGVQLIGPERARELEPHARVVAALHSPGTAVVDFREVALAMGRILEGRGARLVRDARFLRVARPEGEILLTTSTGEFRVQKVVTCAGLHADAVARQMGVNPGVQIVPFRGEYYAMKPGQKLVRGLIYPVPDPRFPFLGVHFTKRISGPYEAGPNAVLAFAREGYRIGIVRPVELMQMAAYAGFWRMVGRYWRTGAGEMYRSLSKPAFVDALQRLVPELQESDLEPGGSGVRAQAVTRDGKLADDFLIVESPGGLHVVNAPSPAATASLAIGRHVAELAAGRFGLS